MELDYSPIRGPEGNIEYLIRLKKGAESMGKDMEEAVASVTDKAFEELAK